MTNQKNFVEKLHGILEYAEERNRRITRQEAEQYFWEDKLTDEQMELVFDYLLSQRVVVSGYEKKGGRIIDASEKTVYSAEEQEYLKEYEHDLKAMKPAAEGETEKLFELAADGVASARSRLIEIFLPVVVETAKEEYRQDIFIGDLVQEGNVSLMLALDLLEKGSDYDTFVRNEIRQGMQAFAEESIELKNRDNRMVERVHDLDEGITKLTEEMGRKVTLEELSAFLEVPEEEIRAVIKLAGEETDEETAAEGEDIVGEASVEIGGLPEEFDDMDYKG